MRAEDNIEVKDINSLETMRSQPRFIEQLERDGNKWSYYKVIVFIYIVIAKWSEVKWLLFFFSQWVLKEGLEDDSINEMQCR